MLGLDYATKHSEKQLREAMKLGIRFVVRYLAPEYLHQYKSILADEAEMLRALGLGVVSVYQRRNTQIEDFDLEHARLDAGWARDNARLAGQTEGPIYFAMDFDAQEKHLPILQAYLDEVAHLLKDTAYEIGVYGSYRVVERLRCAHKWQTYAWSKGKVSRKARFIQCHNGVGFAGGSNDLNVTFAGPGCWIPPADTTMPDMPMLQLGMKQWHVSVLQSLLAREGYDTGGIDGIFGPLTDGAVTAYQASKGLDVDGIAGPDTWGELLRQKIPSMPVAPAEGDKTADLENRITVLEEKQTAVLELLARLKDVFINTE